MTIYCPKKFVPPPISVNCFLTYLQGFQSFGFTNKVRARAGRPAGGWPEARCTAWRTRAGWGGTSAGTSAGLWTRTTGSGPETPPALGPTNAESKDLPTLSMVINHSFRKNASLFLSPLIKCKPVSFIKNNLTGSHNRLCKNCEWHFYFFLCMPFCRHAMRMYFLLQSFWISPPPKKVNFQNSLIANSALT